MIALFTDEAVGNRTTADNEMVNAMANSPSNVSSIVPFRINCFLLRFPRRTRVTRPDDLQLPMSIINPNAFD
jgi:hypothetical protein